MSAADLPGAETSLAARVDARIAVIACGGAIGTLARAGLAEALPHRPDQWPWATFIANLAGAFILGWLLTRLAERTAPSRHWRFFAGTGFCGALTTFSTFSFETVRLLEENAFVHAAANVGLSVVAGVVALFGGWSLATTVF
jgi:fluoride exporter